MLQYRQLGLQSAHPHQPKHEATGSGSSDTYSRLTRYWEAGRCAKLVGGNGTYYLCALLNVTVWFAFLLFHIHFTVENEPGSMSLGQQSAWVKRSNTCAKLNVRDEHWAGDLREYEGAWNRLCFGPARRRLRIGAFVKTWPINSKPGGMEHHASTLYNDLASRGHDVHVFTTIPNGEDIIDHVEGRKLQIHIVNSQGGSAEESYWQSFLAFNQSSPFDVVHTESISLAPRKAKRVSTTAATWHGISAERIHSDIALERNWIPGEPKSAEHERDLVERLRKIVQESRNFESYGHHVAISDYVADVLRTMYEFPVERVHTIFNGVNDAFRPNAKQGAEFRAKYGVPANAIVFGVAGRLVKDKGHPLLFEAFVKILERHSNVYLMVAGSGPWLSRFSRLAPGKPNVVAAGVLTPEELNGFYNALDVFLNPTLRSQGLDTTLIEALQCGKRLMATRFASITWSVILNKEFGSTFAPNVADLTAAMEGAIRDGREKLALGADTRVEYARMMFTAAKMGAAYERLFLCLSDDAYCSYPLSTDQC